MDRYRRVASAHAQGRPVTGPQSAEAVHGGPVTDDKPVDLMTAYARLVADRLSEMLPEGMRFEWK